MALDGVPSQVAIPVPRPDTPVLIGRPVQDVSVPLEGVPKTGVVRVGLVRVLLVSVCVPARLTSVSVAPGIVTVTDDPAAAAGCKVRLPDDEPNIWIAPPTLVLMPSDSCGAA